jgi:hypothetical protein
METKSLINSTEWLTIDEAIEFIEKQSTMSIGKNNLYRLLLSEKITPSLYFQSPVLLKKILQDTQNNKHFHKQNLIFHFCHMDPANVKYSQYRYGGTIKTTGEVFLSPYTIWDTKLTGIERIYVQKSLARLLSIPEPVTGQYNHSGIVVNDDHGNSYQLFEMDTIGGRINSHLKKIKNKDNKLIHAILNITKTGEPETQKLLNQRTHFPLYHLPDDAVFVIRKKYLVDFLARHMPQEGSNRLSTPVARLFWLACKNNPCIGNELIKNPYKLQSLFETWAHDAGMTDRFSGDTLKKVLKRGNPFS